jgi:hypothetical protein
LQNIAAQLQDFRGTETPEFPARRIIKLLNKLVTSGSLIPEIDVSNALP